MTDSNSRGRLSSEVVAEIGLREDLVGEALLKPALRMLWPFLKRVNNGVYLETTFSSILQWIDDDAVSSSNSQIAHPAGTRGLKTEFPVHALLLHIGAKRSPSEKYLHLCAHVVWIAQTLQEAINRNIAGTGNTSGVAGNRREVCRRMRKLSDKALEFLPDIPDSSQHLHQRIKRFSPLGQTKGLNKTCEILERSSAYALALRGSPFRDGYPGAKKSQDSTPKKFWERKFDLLDPDDQYADEEAFTIRSEAEPDGLSPQALIRSGAAPDEGQSQTRLLISHRPIKVQSGESLADQPFRSRNAHRHAVKNEQMTPSQWRRLSHFDLHVLIKVLRENEAEDPYVSIFLAISLLTGSSSERVLESQIYRSTTDIPRKLDAGALCIVLSDRVWVRGVLRPDYAKSARSEWLRYVEATSPKLTFPIPEELMSILVSRLKELPLDSNPGKRRPLFPLRDAPILEPVKIFLSKLNERYKTRVTLLRLQQTLFDMLTVGEGDRAEAALITGQMPSTGQATSLYYYWTKKSDLVHIYKKALARLPVPISFEWSARSGALSFGVGSEICPKTKPLQLLVKDLQNAIEIARRNWAHQDAWIDFHNCYTRYVIVMVLFATGHRAVQDPIPYAEDIDWERGLVVINDKTGDYMQKDRLVPLVPACLLQLEEFVRHRNSVLTRMRVILKSSVPNELPFFFFLSGDLKPQNVQPKTLQDQLSDTYDLPLNINRHLLRSTLRKQGLPGTAVDAFMGHWSDGQNPFDRFSAMDPQVFLSQCSEALETLFSESGWKVVEGLS